MSRPLFLGLIVFCLLLGGLVVLNGRVVSLAIPFLAYWIYALWRSPQEIQLEITREVSAERAAPQAPVRVKVRVTNVGQSLDVLALQDVVDSSLSVSDGGTHHLLALPAGRTFEFEYTVRGPRGAFSFGNVHAEAADALALLPIERDIPTSGQLLIFPSISRIREVPIRPRRTRVYAGAIPARLGGAGVEFFGVRGYEPGDPPRRINWHITAHHEDELFSNEFQQERVADIAVVLDGRARANVFAGGHSIFEHSVLAAGAMADALLSHGNRVGLLVYSRFLQWTFPGYGRVQRDRILYALSQAELGASQVFEGLQYLPTRLFPSESQIILVSPLLEDDYSTLIQLRARGYQVMVVCPDPVTYEARHLPRPRSRLSSSDVDLATRVVRLERTWMLDRIRRAGIHVVEWDVARPFDQVSRSAFRRFGRPRLSL